MMKTRTKAALTLTAVLALAACKDDDDKKDNTANNQTSAIEQSEETSLADRYAFNTTIPVTRNGVDFTVDVKAACSAMMLGDSYETDCTAKAAEAMQEKFMCSRWALAAGATRTNNQSVLERGLQGTYREFPSQYLFDDEEFENALKANQKSILPGAVTVITDISDLDAAAFTDPEGTKTRDLCPDFP